MYQSVNTLLQLYEDTEVSEVANLCCVLRADRIFLLDSSPWILLQLTDAERHLALLAIKCQNLSLNLVTYLEEVLCRTQVLAPRHLRNVDETLNARCNLYECTVVSDDNNLTLDAVTNLEVRVKCIPWVWCELLQTEGDSLLLIIEVEDNHVNLLVKLYNLVWIAYAAPREVCDVYETVNAAEVDEYTVRSDVLNSTLIYLTLLQLRHNLFLLCLKLSLDESLVRHNDIAELLIYLDNLKFHCLAYEYIVVTDRMNVNLRTWQECLHSKYVHNHTTLGTTFDEALYDLFILKSLVNTLPTLSHMSLLV